MKEENHVISRAYERYGLKLDCEDLWSIVASIEGRKSILLARIPDWRTHLKLERHIVTVKNVAIKLLYSPSLKKIITIEPENHKKPPHYYTYKAKRSRFRKNKTA